MSDIKAQQRQQDVIEEWEHPTDGSAFDDPLLDCLVFLTRHYGRVHSHDALRAGLPLQDHRLTPELFLRAAERAQLSARVVRRPLEKISSLVLPAVLLLNNRQCCLLMERSADGSRLTIMQPESGEGTYQIAVKDLEQQYSGYAIFVRSEHRFDDRAPEVLRLRSRHWFWGTLVKSWRIYRDVLVSSFLINLFALASPLFIMNVYDRVVPNNAIETLWVLAIGVAVVYLFDVIMRSLRGYFIDVAGKKSDILLSSMLFERVLGIKMAARPPSVGAFANNLREFESIRDFITSATVVTLVDLPFVLLFLLVIWFIGGPLVYVPLVTIPIVLIYGVAVQSPLRRSVEATYRASAQKGATLIESLTAVETIKHLGAESELQRKWEQLTGQIAQWGVRSRLLSASVSNVATFFQQMSQVGIVVLGVYLIAEGELSMGALIAGVILVGRALAPMAQVANLAVRYYQAKTALGSLTSVMELPIERPQGKSFLSREQFEGGIELDDVSFSYPGEEKAALSNVSLTISAGEKVAIIGKVGSGKTTIEKLMQGLYDPDSGAVRIDGADLRQVDPADLRRSIGYVPQDIMLFYGSVRDNIVLGAPYADDNDILQVAKIAGVMEFVNQHPHGFDMQVGERGDYLSGGQRQAIAIARALLLDPPILMLDEPSNSMDNSTEAILKRQLSEYAKNKTLILVTHRSSLLELVDRLIVIDGGRVIADGPKAQVLEALKQSRGGVSKAEHPSK
ncbi:MAG: type I secretion system permease/ATPase [gamma proteobacterium symbiont of Ctena orbiculata]|uniref:Type I secretion system permease/ATPase n=1 Tax=Candidatus Thiodiazotropha taylori TaxID=2792791 RepID=A0A944MCU3_9GAMM|nr:type I secretion system permease/ATPase [Candidatus Thiodiazotropha taylori]PUB82976.1 MAG: type I secretion system permease/ATPase [gamma proteobacterium symbiont of Ctena orbiculata]MBT2990324.1 type I secretion system permease/ATPase [Candidatus Thiodiazotropha taylori]MBT2998252.1 type I secretion system permease/ATPase [Candidatus Thiodiazotropha taylori]MBT3002550.1 type I secretion system permease/ATPase [Candidatus Thiodiazotropha taylori]